MSEEISQEWEELAAQQALSQYRGVVQLGRAAYAVSLIWNKAEGHAGLLQEAREAATRLDASLIAVLPGARGQAAQYALGDTLLQHAPGMPSLAAALDAKCQGSFYAAWRLSDELWYLFGRLADGTILYDKAVSHEAVARSEFDEGLEHGEWNQVLAPAEWQIAGSQHSTLDLSTYLGSSKVRLRPLQVNRVRLLLRIVGVVIVLLVIWFAYQQIQGMLARHAEEARLAEDARLAAQAALSQQRVGANTQLPWSDSPLPAALISACSQGLRSHEADAASLPGWQIGSAQCDGHSLSYQLKPQENNKSSANWSTALAASLPGQPTLSVNDQQATLSWPLAKLARYPRQSPGMPLDAVRRNLTAQLNELLIPLSLTPGEQQLYWQGLKFSLSFKQDPDVLLPIFGRLPATVISQLSYQPDSHEWTLQGQIYQRLQPSPAEVAASQQR